MVEHFGLVLTVGISLPTLGPSVVGYILGFFFK